MSPKEPLAAPLAASGADLATAIATLTDSLGSDEFGARLLGFLNGQVGVDSAMVVRYHPRRRPKLLAEALAHPLRSNSAAAYIGGAYLLDPMFQRTLGVRSPELIRLSDIVTEDFPDSEYVRSYYGASKVVDEVNYLVPVPSGNVFAVCLERASGGEAFDQAQMRRFRDWLPLVAALFRQHVRLPPRSASLPAEDAVDHEHNRLQAVLDRFGQQQLTPREHEIAQLLLRGRSTPIIARELQVSAQTVRVHRRNIYDKLDVSSLGELFTLAMRSLMGDHARDA